MRSKVGLLLVMVALASHSTAGAVQAPVAVSPGSPGGSRVQGGCPTFSWSGIEGATGYEIVLYDLTSEEGSEEGLVVPAEGRMPRLHRRLAGLVLSWTPSFEECLQSERRYAWTVRALLRNAPTSWSEPALFTVVDPPSATQVQQALETLRRYLEAEVRTAGPDGAERPAGTRDGDGPAGASSQGAREPGPSATAFIESAGVRVAYEESGGFVTAAVEAVNSAAGPVGALNYGLFVQRERPAGSLEGGAAIYTYTLGPQGTDSFVLLGQDTGHALRAYGHQCCNGADFDDYVAAIQNFWQDDDPDVLALSTKKVTPGPASNFIGFFAPQWPGGPNTLIGEIEADGQGGIHYKGGHLTLVPTDLPMSCSGGDEGRIYFDDSLNEPCYCDGIGWKQMDGGGAC